MKKKFLIIFCLIGILITSCILNLDNQSNDDTFSFVVHIVDVDNNPVPGLNLTLLSPIELNNYMRNRAHTVIYYDVAETCFVTIVIENIVDEYVCELVSDTLSGGHYSLNWNGKDDYLNSVPSGVYFCRMKAELEGTEIYNDRIMMYLQSYNSENRTGISNDDGKFICNSLIPFPSFYDLDSLICIDEIGCIVDVITFPDSIEIYLSDSENPNLYQSVRVLPDKHSQQDIHIVWQPQEEKKNNSTAEMNKIMKTHYRAGFPFFETKLKGNCPNPFN